MFNPSTAQPIRRELLVWDIVADGQTLANYVGGEFTATLNTTDKSKNPPWIASGKGLLSRSRINSGTVTVKNCQFRDIGRQPGIHTDGIFFSSDVAATGMIYNFIDVDIRNIDGEGLHHEGGSAKRLLYRGCTVKSASGDRITIKLVSGARIGDIVLDNTSGNLVVDATRTGHQEIGKILPVIYANNFTGNTSVTLKRVDNGRDVYYQVPLAQVGIKLVNGLPSDLAPVTPPTPKPTPTPIPTPAMLSDVTGFTLHTGHGDMKYTSDAKGTVQITLDGFTYKFRQR